MLFQRIGVGCVFLAAVSVLPGFPQKVIAQTERYEDRKLVSADALLRQDQLGQSVAVSGTRIFAGGTWDETLQYTGGSVFEFDSITGLQRMKYRAPDSAINDRFGYSIALYGDLLVVGAPYNDAEGQSAGAAYMFNVRTGEYLRRLSPTNPQAGALFGFVVAIDGQSVVVSAPYRENMNIIDAGAVYVFDAATGVQQFELTPTDAAAEDHFGLAMTVNALDRTIVVGAPGVDGNQTDEGAIYAFSVTTGEQTGRVVALDRSGWAAFGTSVAYQGDRFIVGAPGANNGEGAAYVFDSITGQQLTKLGSPTPRADSQFGFAVYLTDNHILIGEPGDDSSQRAIGSVFVLDRATYTPVLEMLQTDPPPGWPDDERDGFGKVIAVDGMLCALGAPRHNSDEGAVYLYNFSPRVLAMSDSVIANAGDPSVDFEVTAEDAATYQWRMDGVDLQDNAFYSGTQTRQLTIQPQVVTEGLYDVVMTNSLGESVSPAVVLGVRQPCIADINDDGVIDTRDVLAFLNLWTAGCP